jgi:Zn-dependent protease
VSQNVKLALFMLVILAPSLALHECAHAFAADRMGDHTARRWGRMTLNLKPHVDRFGTIVLPGLLLILVAAGYFPPVFAYAKPMPFDPTALRNPDRGVVWYALAGPFANLGTAIVFGLALRLLDPGTGSTIGVLLFAGLVVNVVLFIFNLMPVPGLDGSKLLARFLSFRARELYQRMDEYLPLFMLVIFFLLAAPALSIVRALGNATCRLIGVGDCL